MDILHDAIIFALNAHNGQTRKAKDKPYILHPLEVCTIAGYLTDDREVIAAAVLHDVVEDTPVTSAEILQQFGGRVTRLVNSDSEDKMDYLPSTLTWEIRKQNTLDILSKADRDEQIICLADKLANVRELKRDYELLGDNLWDKFNQKDKKKHEWYYRSIADKLTYLKETSCYKEYVSILNELFAR